VFALAMILLLRHPLTVVLVLISAHALATVGGLFGGAIGWREGLGAYFGTFVAFVICVAFWGSFRRLSRSKYEPKIAA
jgi:hypothetical protein